MDDPGTPGDDRPHPGRKRRPTPAEIYSEGPASRGGKVLFIAVFLAGAALLIFLWIAYVVPLFQQPPHPTAICYGKLHGCLSFSASDEWVTETVETAALWGIGGLFGYGALRVARSRLPPTDEPS
jgi:hypothetical protein